MKLRTCSAAVVAIVLGTSAWADDGALDAANFVNVAEETFAAQLVDLAGSAQTAMAAEDAFEHDPIAAIVDRIAQNTILVGSLSVPADEAFLVTTLGLDPAEVTGSIQTVELAAEGLEDR